MKRNKLLPLFLVLVVAFSFELFACTPEATFSGLSVSPTAIGELGEEYVFETPEVKYGTANASVSVVVTKNGEVIPSDGIKVYLETEGEYLITYTAVSGSASIDKTTTLTVSDTKGPAYSSTLPSTLRFGSTIAIDEYITARDLSGVESVSYAVKNIDGTELPAGAYDSDSTELVINDESIYGVKITVSATDGKNNSSTQDFVLDTALVPTYGSFNFDWYPVNTAPNGISVTSGGTTVDGVKVVEESGEKYMQVEFATSAKNQYTNITFPNEVVGDFSGFDGVKVEMLLDYSTIDGQEPANGGNGALGPEFSGAPDGLPQNIFQDKKGQWFSYIFTADASMNSIADNEKITLMLKPWAIQNVTIKIKSITGIFNNLIADGEEKNLVELYGLDADNTTAVFMPNVGQEQAISDLTSFSTTEGGKITLTVNKADHKTGTATIRVNEKTVYGYFDFNDVDDASVIKTNVPSAQSSIKTDSDGKYYSVSFNVTNQGWPNIILPKTVTGDFGGFDYVDILVRVTYDPANGNAGFYAGDNNSVPVEGLAHTNLYKNWKVVRFTDAISSQSDKLGDIRIVLNTWYDGAITFDIKSITGGYNDITIDGNAINLVEKIGLSADDFSSSFAPYGETGAPVSDLTAFNPTSAGILTVVASPEGYEPTTYEITVNAQPTYGVFSFADINDASAVTTPVSNAQVSLTNDTDGRYLSVQYTVSNGDWTNLILPKTLIGDFTGFDFVDILVRITTVTESATKNAGFYAGDNNKGPVEGSAYTNLYTSWKVARFNNAISSQYDKKDAIWIKMNAWSAQTITIDIKTISGGYNELTSDGATPINLTEKYANIKSATFTPEGGSEQEVTDLTSFTSAVSGTLEFVSGATGYKDNTYTVSYVVQKAITSNATNATINDLPNNAKVGSTVSFTVTPDANYHITTVTMNGTPLTENSGTYSFTMPDATANIVVAAEIDTNAVTYTSSYAKGNATLTLKNGNATVTNGDAIAYGTVLTITATADSGYTVTVLVNGNAYTESTITVTEEITVTLDIVAESDVQFKVNVYTQNAETGEYSKNTLTKYGEVDTIPEWNTILSIPANCTLDTTRSTANYTTWTIKGDGTGEVDIYYTLDTYTVSVDTVRYGSVSVTPVTARVGQTVTITATADTDYKLVKTFAYNTGDSSTAVTVTNNTFVMPANNVTASAEFISIPVYGDALASFLNHKEVGDSLGERGTQSASVVEYDGKKAIQLTAHRATSGTNYDADLVSFKSSEISNLCKFDYVVFKISFMTDNTSAHNINAKFHTLNGSSWSDWKTIYVNGVSEKYGGTGINQYNHHTFIYKISETGSVLASNSSELGFTFALWGEGNDTILIREIYGGYNELTSDGVSAVNLTEKYANLKSATFAPEGGSAQEVTDLSAFVGANNGMLALTFGKADCIDNTFEVSYSVVKSITSSATKATISNLATSAKVGSTVSFNVAADENYHITSVKMNGTPLTENSGNYSFTMPNAAANIEVLAEIDTYAVTFNSSVDTGNATLTVMNDETAITSGDAIAYGTVLTLTATADDGYTVTVRVNGDIYTESTITVTETLEITLECTAGSTPYTLNVYTQNAETGEYTLVTETKYGQTDAVAELGLTTPTNCHVNTTKSTADYSSWVVPGSGDGVVDIYYDCDTYTVSVVEPDNGTLTVSATTVRVGQTVTITVAANTDYRVKSVTAYNTGDESATIAISDNKFTMPANNATVTAKIISLPTYGYFDFSDVDDASLITGDTTGTRQIVANNDERYLEASNTGTNLNVRIPNSMIETNFSNFDYVDIEMKLIRSGSAGGIMGLSGPYNYADGITDSNLFSKVSSTAWTKVRFSKAAAIDGIGTLDQVYLCITSYASQTLTIQIKSITGGYNTITIDGNAVNIEEITGLSNISAKFVPFVGSESEISSTTSYTPSEGGHIVVNVNETGYKSNSAISIKVYDKKAYGYYDFVQEDVGALSAVTINGGGTGEVVASGDEKYYKYTKTTTENNATPNFYFPFSYIGDFSAFDYLDIQIKTEYSSNGGSLGVGSTQYKKHEGASSNQFSDFKKTDWVTARYSSDMAWIVTNQRVTICMQPWAAQTITVYIKSIRGGFNAIALDNEVNTSVNLVTELGLSASEMTNVKFNGSTVSDVTAFSATESGTLTFTAVKSGYKNTDMSVAVTYTALKDWEPAFDFANPDLTKVSIHSTTAGDVSAGSATTGSDANGNYIEFTIPNKSSVWIRFFGMNSDLLKKYDYFNIKVMGWYINEDGSDKTDANLGNFCVINNAYTSNYTTKSAISANKTLKTYTKSRTDTANFEDVISSPFAMIIENWAAYYSDGTTYKTMKLRFYAIEFGYNDMEVDGATAITLTDKFPFEASEIESATFTAADDGAVTTIDGSFTPTEAGTLTVKGRKSGYKAKTYSIAITVATATE